MGVRAYALCKMLKSLDLGCFLKKKGKKKENYNS